MKRMLCWAFFLCKMDRMKIKRTNQLEIAQNKIWTRRKFPAIWHIYCNTTDCSFMLLSACELRNQEGWLNIHRDIKLPVVPW